MTDVADSYHSTYYQDHRDEIRDKRKKRYLEDSEYRESRKAAARLRKKRLRDETRAERRRLGLKPGERLVKSPMSPPPHLITIAGVDYTVPMKSAGELAKALNRTTQTIRLWEKKGILPEALYRDGRKMRLYPAFQVGKIKEAYKQAQVETPRQILTRISQTSFPAATAQIWKEWPLGVDVDALQTSS